MSLFGLVGKRVKIIGLNIRNGLSAARGFGELGSLGNFGSWGDSQHNALIGIYKCFPLFHFVVAQLHD